MRMRVARGALAGLVLGAAGSLGCESSPDEGRPDTRPAADFPVHFVTEGDEWFGHVRWSVDAIGVRVLAEGHPVTGAGDVLHRLDGLSIGVALTPGVDQRWEMQEWSYFQLLQTEIREGEIDSVDLVTPGTAGADRGEFVFDGTSITFTGTPEIECLVHTVEIERADGTRGRVHCSADGIVVE